MSQCEQILIGSLLGDGGLIRNNKQVGIRFKENHSLKQKEYLLWKKLLLQDYFKVGYYESATSCSIYTNVSPKLKYFFEQFYPSGSGYKKTSLEILNKLKPLGLAIWYMDDGHYNKRANNLIFSIDKSNYINIKQWFFKKFDISIKFYNHFINGGVSARIILNSKDSKKIIKVIKPYIHPSMIYKVEITTMEKERMRNELQQWRANNKIKMKDYSRKYLDKLKKEYPYKFERRRQRNNQYRKEWYIKNKDYMKQYSRKYYNEHIKGGDTISVSKQFQIS